MTFRKYSTSQFAGLKEQHNILAFVGNGFDIQVMRDFGQESDTRYETFYHFLKFRRFNGDNLILSEMERLRLTDAKDWSDLEAAVGGLLTVGSATSEDLYAALREIQEAFSDFLNHVVPNSLLAALGQLSSQNEGAVTSLSSFIGDLDAPSLQRFGFPGRTSHYDLYNFAFVNFNYTHLLDGYVFLDQDQFDPQPYRQADRNFTFYPNPKGWDECGWNERTRWSSYVAVEVLHPHGHQGIPRSLLFGIDAETSRIPSGVAQRTLQKPFWAQNDIRYSGFFDDAELFIIFGCSLGASDGWWWRKIAQALATSDEAELLIYWRTFGHAGDLDADGVVDRFVAVAGLDDTDVAAIRPKIFVVTYNEASDRVWLTTSLPDG